MERKTKARDFVEKALCALLEYGLLLSLIWSALFWRLDVPSFHQGDETIYVRVVEDMRAKGNWFSPTMDDEGFYSKPPLAFWLSTWSIKLFGNSNASHRYASASAGAGTALLTYHFGRLFFQSRFAALTSVVALLGARSYVLFHGPRSANLDSLLSFFSVLLLLFGWKFLTSPSSNRAVLPAFALTLTLALLTKSAAGLNALLVLAPFGLTKEEYRTLVRKRLKAIIAVLFIPLCILGLYIVSHCALSAEGCRVLVQDELVERALVGYHNVNQPFYYLDFLVQNRIVPVKVFLLGLLIAVFWAIRKREPRAIFLLCWALVPIAAYSVLQSRLIWYVFFAFPGLALLVGLVVKLGVDLFEENSEIFSLPRFIRVFSVPLSLFCLAFAVVPSLLSYVGVIKSINEAPGPIAFEQAIDGFQNIRKRAHEVPELGYSTETELWLGEEGYLARLKPGLRQFSSTELLSRISSGETGLALLRHHEIFKALESRKLFSYVLLPPYQKRGNWLVAACFLEAFCREAVPYHSHTRQVYDFGDPKLKALFGFREPAKMGSLPVRLSEGSDSAVLIPSDWLFEELGSTAFVNFSLVRVLSAEMLLDVFVNHSKVATLQLNKSGFRTYRFDVPPEVLRDGENVFSFVLQEKFPSSVTPIVFNWLSLHLAQSQARLEQ